MSDYWLISAGKPTNLCIGTVDELVTTGKRGGGEMIV